jgi:hypothetical protein
MLPPEIVYLVFEFLSERELVIAGVVSRLFYRIASIPNLLYWNRMITKKNLLQSQFSVSKVFFECCRQDRVLSFAQAVQTLGELRYAPTSSIDSGLLESPHQVLWETGLVEAIKHNRVAIAKQLIRFGSPLYQSAIMVYVCRQKLGTEMLRLLLDNYKFTNYQMLEFIRIVYETDWSEGLEILSRHSGSKPLTNREPKD